ncbi:MAG: bifunctional nuclease family protein [Bacteroidia bacterium]|nr:bifunctional nuclease family protein [Bacteroidia bacterium]MDW8333713.1 bifunctional nuclease family protein [Bacteroidia bacterium]
MEKIQLDVLGLSSSHSNTNSYALVLGEVGGNRRLPIIIGAFEAQAIALELENMRPTRPMTHDLFVDMAKQFGIEISEVVISDLRESVFYARIYMRTDDGRVRHEIDARPSDAVALAVRFRAPIYTYDFILKQAGIIIADPSGEFRPAAVSPPSPPPSSSLAKEQQLKKLQERMNDAIRREDYEEAARLRDEINRISG